MIALALLLLAVRTGWFPAGGMTSMEHEQMSPGARAWDVATHLVLPAAALVLGILPALVRHVRASVADVLASPFVRAARAHGIPEGRVLLRHVLPAAANPLVSLFGLSLAGLLSMSLVVEVVMSWPGLGPLLLDAILARDFFLALGLVLVSTVLLVGGNMLADALLLATDPAHPHGGPVSRRRAGGRSRSLAVHVAALSAVLPRSLRAHRAEPHVALCATHAAALRGRLRAAPPAAVRLRARPSEDGRRRRYREDRRQRSRCASSFAEARTRSGAAGSPAPLRRRRARAPLPPRHGWLRLL